jgi:hypothetical protein
MAPIDAVIADLKPHEEGEQLTGKRLLMVWRGEIYIKKKMEGCNKVKRAGYTKQQASSPQ